MRYRVTRLDGKVVIVHADNFVSHSGGSGDGGFMRAVFFRGTFAEPRNVAAYADIVSIKGPNIDEPAQQD